MTANLSDTDLIARVAAKLGWRQEQCPGRKLWVNPDGNYQALPMHIRRLLRSTDACLALVRKTGHEYLIDLTDETHLVKISNSRGDFIGKAIDKSLPGAILLALLEVE